MPESYGHAVGVLRILELQEKQHREIAANPATPQREAEIRRALADEAAERAAAKKAYIDSLAEADRDV